MEENSKPIFKNHSGNRKSEKLTIYPNGNDFKFVYQKFDRTNPSQTEREAGIKPKRLLLEEQIFYIADLSKSNLDQFPFSHLVQDFKPPS